MKTAIINYGLNFIIVATCLLLTNFMWIISQGLYYKYAPISWFYESVLFQVDDVCVGDTTQNTTSVRLVKATDTGYPANVTRELYLVEDAILNKVFEERVQPFVEVRPDGAGSRVQQIPSFLPVGEYQWTLYITLFIHGQQRTDIPPVTSNTFDVLNCEE